MTEKFKTDVLHDMVWMLVHPKKGFWYSPPATSATDAWNNAVKWNTFNNMQQYGQQTLMLMGYRAKRVRLTLHNTRKTK